MTPSPSDRSTSPTWLIEKILEITTYARQAALSKQRALIHILDVILIEVDVLIGLAAAREAPPTENPIDLADHSMIWTMAGLPGMSIPLLSGAGGLPVGLQTTTRRLGDYKLVNLAFNLVNSAGRRPR